MKKLYFSSYSQIHDSMKSNIHSFLFVLAIMVSVFAFSSCTGTSQGSSKSAFSPQTMEDLLRREPGVNVTGTHPSLSLRIRGNSSIMGDNEPLFILNGTPVGSGYSSVANLNPLDVASIRVIAGANAGIYGARGANGVILVKTKGG